MGQLQLWLCVHSQAREGCLGREPTGKVEAGWQGGLAVGRCGLRLGWGGWSFPPVGSAGGGWPNSALSPPYMRPYRLPQLQSLPASSRARGNFCNSFLFLSTKACVFSAFLGTSRSFPGKGKLNLSSAGRGNPPCRAVTCSHPPRQTHLVQAPC